MRIALVNLNVSRDARDPPLGLAYLAAYARKYGAFNDFVIIDNKNPLDAIRKEKPRIVGLGPVTGQYPEANLLAGQIKREMGIPVIIGGHHISALPNHLASSNFDIAVIGEGEHTFLELLQHFESQGGFEESGLEKIDGIVFKTAGGKCRTTSPRQLIIDLDKVPFPARDLLKMKEFYITFRRGMFAEPGVYGHMMTSRGCPYRCRFCASTVFWNRPRFHSPEYVVEEMKHLKETYDVDGILIYDDLFLSNFSRVKRIGELIQAEGLNKELKLLIFGRTDLITEAVLEVLKKMNVRSINFGLESGSEKILNYLKRDSVTVEHNRRALNLCKQYGMRTIGTLIIGCPDETEQDLQQTMDLVRNPNLDEPCILQLTPLPGTEVWQYAMEKGIVSEDPHFPFDALIVRSSSKIRREKFMCKEVSEEKLQEWLTLMQKEAERKSRTLNFAHLKFKHLRYIFSIRFITKIVKSIHETLVFVRNAKFKARRT